MEPLNWFGIFRIRILDLRRCELVSVKSAPEIRWGIEKTTFLFHNCNHHQNALVCAFPMSPNRMPYIELVTQLQGLHHGEINSKVYPRRQQNLPFLHGQRNYKQLSNVLYSCCHLCSLSPQQWLYAHLAMKTSLLPSWSFPWGSIPIVLIRSRWPEEILSQ